MTSSGRIRPFIVFVTGVSAAGKTTMFELLKRDPAFKGVVVRDIDENGVPPVGLSHWRLYRIEELLYQAIQAQKNDISTIICGVCFPGEIIESKYYRMRANIQFVLLRVTFAVFQKRIKARVAESHRRGETNEMYKPASYQSFVAHTKKLIDRFDKLFFNARWGHGIDASADDPLITYELLKTVIKTVANNFDASETNQ